MNHVTDERTDRPLGRHLYDWLETSSRSFPMAPSCPRPSDLMS